MHLISKGWQKDRLVEINCDCEGQKATVEISILQLARVYRCDKKVLEKLEEQIFGSYELEQECKEILEIIKNYPSVKINRDKIICEDVRFDVNLKERVIFNSENMTCSFYSEDLVGWNNEGILVTIPAALFKEKLDGNAFQFILNQDCIELAELFDFSKK